MVQGRDMVQEGFDKVCQLFTLLSFFENFALVVPIFRLSRSTAQLLVHHCERTETCRGITEGFR